MPALQKVLASEVLNIFLAHLAGERRLASKTVEAYQRDLSSFLGFITQHLDTDLNLTHLCLLYTSPSPRDKRQSRMPSSA